MVIFHTYVCLPGGISFVLCNLGSDATMATTGPKMLHADGRTPPRLNIFPTLQATASARHPARCD